MRALFAALLTSMLLVLAGCGQKGPLYLPGHGPDANQAPTQQQPADQD